MTEEGSLVVGDGGGNLFRALTVWGVLFGAGNRLGAQHRGCD